MLQRKSNVLMVCALAMATSVTGCVTRDVVQLRLADPMVALDLQGDISAPQITFRKRIGKGYGDHVETARLAEENHREVVKNRVNLHKNSTYEVEIQLPENFEFRRMQLLQAKSETVYKAIEEAEDRLSENSMLAARVFSENVRKTVLERASEAQGDIEGLNIRAIDADPEERKELEDEIDKIISQFSKYEKTLRADDELRDSLMSPPLVDSLVNQIEDWRQELNRIKSRIVSLQLLAQNPNRPYPRIVRGYLQTFDETPFTQLGAVPFTFEDEYLDWIRDDKVVTIVAYDPNEPPENKEAREEQNETPPRWPRDSLMVVEVRQTRNTLPRGVTSGTAPVTKVERVNYLNATATTFDSPTGYYRTFVYSEKRDRMWVFGPDTTPPGNVEVWLQDERGMPIRQIYPDRSGAPHDQLRLANITGSDGVGMPDPGAWQEYKEKGLLHRRNQVVGIEGSGYDPVVEAMRRGQVVAIARFGNLRHGGDNQRLHEIWRNEMKQAEALTEEW